MKRVSCGKFRWFLEIIRKSKFIGWIDFVANVMVNVDKGETFAYQGRYYKRFPTIAHFMFDPLRLGVALTRGWIFQETSFGPFDPNGVDSLLDEIRKKAAKVLNGNVSAIDEFFLWIKFLSSLLKTRGFPEMPAQENGKYTVLSNDIGLPVRLAPDPSAKVENRLFNGYEIFVVESTDGYLQLDGDGWVSMYSEDGYCALKEDSKTAAVQRLMSLVLRYRRNRNSLDSVAHLIGQKCKRKGQAVTETILSSQLCENVLTYAQNSARDMLFALFSLNDMEYATYKNYLCGLLIANTYSDLPNTKGFYERFALSLWRSYIRSRLTKQSDRLDAVTMVAKAILEENLGVKLSSHEVLAGAFKHICQDLPVGTQEHSYQVGYVGLDVPVHEAFVFLDEAGGSFASLKEPTVRYKGTTGTVEICFSTLFGEDKVAEEALKLWKSNLLKVMVVATNVKSRVALVQMNPDNTLRSIFIASHELLEQPEKTILLKSFRS